MVSSIDFDELNKKTKQLKKELCHSLSDYLWHNLNVITYQELERLREICKKENVTTQEFHDRFDLFCETIKKERQIIKKLAQHNNLSGLLQILNKTYIDYENKLVYYEDKYFKKLQRESQNNIPNKDTISAMNESHKIMEKIKNDH